MCRLFATIVLWLVAASLAACDGVSKESPLVRRCVEKTDTLAVVDSLGHRVVVIVEIAEDTTRCRVV